LPYGGEGTRIARRGYADRQSGPEAMSDSVEYRAHATECQRMADQSKDIDDKRRWLEMAERWMRMIPAPAKSLDDAFDEQEHMLGTHQVKSDASH
jgi:hypothetical protein